MLLYAATIFVSAFLLFQVQPVIAKMILPWFGGGAMVWTSCMLFFQMILLAGYAYSHKITTKPIARQTRLHLILLTLSLASLPIIPKAFLKPSGVENPLFGILLVLTLSVGLPYFMLSTTGPLMQAWYAARNPGRLPYRLFALSNFASLIALIAYPIAVEPRFALRTQGYAWSALYLLFVILCGWTAWRTRGAILPTVAETIDSTTPPPPSTREKLIWMSLAACASILLLAVTNHLSQNVAAIPLLWVLPLSLYLLSFMATFDSSLWYNRNFFIVLTAATLCFMAYPFWRAPGDLNIVAYITAFTAGLFICCMFCHGEVARRKPHPRYLTSFYLMISIGGAVGGLFVSVIAPLLFPFHYELSVGLAILGIVAFCVLYGQHFLFDVIWAGVAVFLLVTIVQDVKISREDNVLMARNFYGALRIRESGADLDATKVRTLINGTINHGEQFVDSRRSRVATTYYANNSGVGLAIVDRQHPGMRVGVIGLGVGTLTTYGRKDDQYKIYEINPIVVDLAKTWFSYLRNTEANVEIVMGDARLSLEKEQPNNFDVLAVDAFSSDAIPVHLLTKEAMKLYEKHIRPDGIIAVHVSNKYLNLYPVVHRIADRLCLKNILVQNRENTILNQFGSDWVLISPTPEVLETPIFRAAGADHPDLAATAPLWTDDYSNLFKIMK